MKPLFSIVVFLTVLTSTIPSQAADVKFIGMRKHRAFLQEDSFEPVPKDYFMFSASVEATSASSVTRSIISAPDDSELTLEFNFEDNSYSFSDDAYVAQEDLDAAYPPGTYRVGVVTAHDGTKSIPLTLANSPYPPAPHISNFDAAQEINPLANFTLRWAAFTGGTTNDFISVEIRDEESETVFSTPDIWKAGALNGKATSVVIPGGKLAGNAPRAFKAHVNFYKVLTRNRTTYKGVQAVSALNSETEVPIYTAAVAPTITKPPQNQTVNVGSNVTFTVQATGTDLTYEWWLDNSVFIDDSGPSLTISNVQPSQAGAYTVTVRNGMGDEDIAETTLNVNCSYTISPSSAVFSALSGEGSVLLGAASDECSWTIENTNSWIQIPAEGIGGGEIPYIVDELPDNKPRFGYLKIAGKPFLVTQVRSFAPDGLAGKTLAFTIQNGSGGFASTGTFRLVAFPATNTYRTTFSYSTNIESGVYTYEKTDAATSVLTLNATIAATLIFTSPRGGIYTAEDGLGGTQAGTFILTDVRADINLDGRGDLLLQRPDGALSTWYMNGTNFISSATLRNGTPASGLRAVSSADFNGDGKNDIYFQHTNGKLYVWQMNKTAFLRSSLLRNQAVAAGWRAVSVADLDNNGSADVILQHTTGKLSAWLFNGVNFLSGLTLTNATGGSPAAAWKVIGTADLNGDGETDVILQHTDTRLAVWYFVGGKFLGTALLRNGVAVGTAWKPFAVKDFNDDGHPDILFQNASNNKLNVWLMNGVNSQGGVLLRKGAAVTGNWKVFGPK